MNKPKIDIQRVDDELRGHSTLEQSAYFKWLKENYPKEYKEYKDAKGGAKGCLDLP